jgi:hypothetical protein
MNPDLINPNQPVSVAQIPQFRNRLDDGTLVVSTAAEPPVKARETKYYICTVQNASMHRPDGTKLPFVEGFLETDILPSQRYLDAEIENGHGYIRFATEAEINMHHMKKDPKGTIEAQLRPAIEAEVREELNAEIMALRNLLESSGVDAEKIAGVSSLSDKLAALKNSGSVIEAPTATVIMQSQAAPLKGIVGSDKLAGMAAGSASTGGLGGPASGAGKK